MEHEPLDEVDKEVTTTDIYYLQEFSKLCISTKDHETSNEEMESNATN